MKCKAVLTHVVCLAAGAAVLFLYISPAGVVAECPGEPGRPCGNGDVNGDGRIDMADAVYLIDWLFRDGPAIAAMGCDQWQGDLAECQSALAECEGALAQCASDVAARIADVAALESQLAATEAARQALESELALCQADLYECRADLEGCESPPPGGSLPATGQTLCYNVSGQVIDCRSTVWPGQDGFYQSGCVMEGRFVDHGNGTVTDRCTGLMWQKETAPGWYNWLDALKYCEGLDLAGHKDWRLPNVRELQSIADYGRHNPSTDPVFGAVSAWYWSSSTLASGPFFVWFVHFGTGDVNVGNRGSNHYARAVRG